MKAKYILIVVVAVLLPAVSNAQSYGVAVPMQASSSRLLDAPAQGYRPVQVATTESVGFSAGNPVATGLTTQTYQVYTSGGSVVSASVGASYATSSVNEYTDAPIASVGGMSLPQVWKGKVSAVGARSPMDNGLTKRKGFPGNPGDPNPDPPAPLGDTPWVVVLLLAVAYGVSRRWRSC